VIVVPDCVALLQMKVVGVRNMFRNVLMNENNLKALCITEGIHFSPM